MHQKSSGQRGQISLRTHHRPTPAFQRNSYEPLQLSPRRSRHGLHVSTHRKVLPVDEFARRWCQTRVESGCGVKLVMARIRNLTQGQAGRTQHLYISRPALTFGNYIVGFKEDTLEIKVSSFAPSQPALLLQDVKPELCDIRTPSTPACCCLAHRSLSLHIQPQQQPILRHQIAHCPALIALQPVYHPRLNGSGYIAE